MLTFCARRFPHLRRLTVLAVACCGIFAPALAQGDKLSILKVEPPNWFASLPAPMLLIEGTGLGGASFTVSDPAIHVVRTLASANGHWLMLWLDTTSAQPEQIMLTASGPGGTVAIPYVLKPKRTAENGPAGFSSRDVLYLIMPDRFADGDTRNDQIAGSPVANRLDPHAYHGGDLRGVTDHLDYLKQLGVSSVWLTPILQNNPKSSDYHGYGATNLYAVEPRLGTLEEYKELAGALHSRNMKLVFDDVPNHVGPGNLWVTDPPLPDWFHGTPANHLDNQYVFAPVSDPHAAEAASLNAEDGWFVNVLPDLNQQNPEVAQYLIDNMIWWIEETGIDALRIDTFQYVQRAFWQSYLGTLHALYPHLTEVGEISGPDPTITAYFAGGRPVEGIDTHLTTPFDYPLYFTLTDVLIGRKPMSDLEETLRKDWLYPHPEALVPFLSNHDQIRFLSQPGASPALLRLGFGLLLTLRGMPELYAGDEVEMQGGQDPDNRRDFPGGFPGDLRNAFTPQGRTASQNQMHDWVSALGKLRGQSPALQIGTQQTLLAGTSTFAYLRTLATTGSACSATGSMLILLNRAASATDIKLPVQHTALEGCASFTPTLGDIQGPPQPITGSSVTVTLPPSGFEIFTLR